MPRTVIVVESHVPTTLTVPRGWNQEDDDVQEPESAYWVEYSSCCCGPWSPCSAGYPTKSHVSRPVLYHLAIPIPVTLLLWTRQCIGSERIWQGLFRVGEHPLSRLRAATALSTCPRLGVPMHLSFVCKTLILKKKKNSKMNDVQKNGLVAMATSRKRYLLPFIIF